MANSSERRWRRVGMGAALGVGVVGLFLAYLRMSRAIWVNSDGASNALQAWDMLHGNVLLRGWTLTDVSFYTVELPIYALVEWVHGLDVDTVHIAAALIYTAVLVVGCVLARGRARGWEGVARVGVVLFIMAVPQPGAATGILLGSPDHFGTSLALLLLFLLLDRRSEGRLTPLWLGLGLAWTLVSDATVLYLGIVPVMAVYGWRSLRGLRELRALRVWSVAGTDARIVAAAVAAYPAARLAEWGMRAAGGYQAYPPSTALAPTALWPSHAAQAGKAFLLLYGIDTGAGHGWTLAGWVVRGIGVGLVVWAVWFVVRRVAWVRPVDVVLVLAVVINLVAFAASTMAGSGVLAREVSDTLPLGAVFAGRVAGSVLGRALARVGLVRVGLVGVGGEGGRAGVAPVGGVARVAGVVGVVGAVGAVAGVGLLFANATRQGETEPSQLVVAQWLERQGLTYGVGRYWDASVTTVRSGGRVMVRPIDLSGAQPSPPVWDYSERWYDAAGRNGAGGGGGGARAQFVLVDPYDPAGVTVAQARRMYGTPTAVYQVGGRQVLVYAGGLVDEGY